jgi:hypothetical protein
MTSANSTPHFKGIITPAVEEPATPAVYGLVGLNSLVKITKVGPYMGTETVFTLTAAEAPTAASYAWTLPDGVNPIGDVTGNVITVTFDGAELKTIGALPIVVQSVGGCGTSTTARTLTLARALPTAPTKLVLTEGNSETAITKVGAYTKKSTQLTLTATPFTTQGGTATSYAWILPAGIFARGGVTMNGLTASSGVAAELPSSSQICTSAFFCSLELVNLTVTSRSTELTWTPRVIVVAVPKKVPALVAVVVPFAMLTERVPPTVLVELIESETLRTQVLAVTWPAKVNVASAACAKLL